jgi:NAD(P)-dependent dehydrogenase (short-subunit alcohol dehydrogenase family)
MESKSLEMRTALQNRSLIGKVALVTGAGRGIGKAIAVGFAREGADVVVVSRSTNEIEQTAAEIHELGRKAIAVAADVSKVDEVRRIAAETGQHFGKLDILVNNAGVRMIHLGKRDSYFIPLSELSVEDWDRTIAVNLGGPFLCIKLLLLLLRQAGAASIINISAGGGKKGMAGRSPYCASKFGLEGLTQSLALEFQSLNIAVNSLSPGKHSIFTDEEKREQLKTNPELVFMRPEMMVPPAVFLALQNGSGVTGQHLEALEWIAQNGFGTTEDWKVKA